MNLAIRKCKEIGVSTFCVMNSHHFGATGLYAEMAAREGAIALVTSSARTVAVIHTGGTIQVLGTNPIAFAAPSGRGHPFLLDMSPSAVAANKVKVYAFCWDPTTSGVGGRR